jgi:hypothetical protein
MGFNMRTKAVKAEGKSRIWQLGSASSKHNWPKTIILQTFERHHESV